MYLRYYLNEKSQRVYTFNVSEALPLTNHSCSSMTPAATPPSALTPLASPLMTPSLSRE